MKKIIQFSLAFAAIFFIANASMAQVHTFTNNTACTLYVELTYYFDDGTGGACGVVCSDFIKMENATVIPGGQFITNNGPFYGNSAGNWGMLMVTDPSGDAEQAGPCGAASGPITCSGSTITLNWTSCLTSSAN